MASQEVGQHTNCERHLQRDVLRRANELVVAHATEWLQVQRDLIDEFGVRRLRSRGIERHQRCVPASRPAQGGFGSLQPSEWGRADGRILGLESSSSFQPPLIVSSDNGVIAGCDRTFQLISKSVRRKKLYVVNGLGVGATSGSQR